MSESDTPRPPGPWDAKSKEAAVAPPPPKSAEPVSVQAAEPPLDKGQSPLLAVASTVILGVLIWVLTKNWVIAVAAIWGLFVHEYGHVLAMNRVGMGPARIYIIPFFGGAARGQRLPESEWHGVLVSLAGPAFGLLAAIPFLAGFVIQGHPLWLEGVFTIAVINLVNLLPAPPLDGSKALGPVLARIHPMVEQGALVLVGAAVVIWGLTTGRLLLALILGIALLGHLRRGGWRPEGRPLTLGESVRSVGLFGATAVACAGVALAALLPVSHGLDEALQLAGRYFGLGR